VYGDSTWEYSRAGKSFARDSRRFASVTDADNPNITRFAARTGKLILWHGWADPALNPLATIDYYGKVLAADPRAREYVRLFMEPGVLHCGGGNGPSSVAWLRLMTDWVERAKAPEQVVATKRDSTGRVTRTRPLCAYPQRAVYKGQGSTDDASNFVCREGRS
jgi:feruloyl esterase